MLENLLNLIRAHAEDSIINNPAIPNERNEEAINTTSDSIINGLQNALASGNINDVMHMFNSSHNVTGSPVAQGIQNNLIENLMHRFGLQNSQASGIAASIIPIVLKQLVHKTNDPNDNSFNIQGIFNQLSGGKTGGLDIGGLITQFTGRGQQQNSGGGIFDTLKGLFGGQ